jgi:hypothetical protein
MQASLSNGIKLSSAGKRCDEPFLQIMRTEGGEIQLIYGRREGETPPCLVRAFESARQMIAGEIREAVKK